MSDWNKNWRQVDIEQRFWRIRRDENDIRWIRIRRYIEAKFGGFRGLQCIELGAGTGTYSSLFAQHGAHVTLLDDSSEALAKARQIFMRLGLEAEFVMSNVFRLPQRLLGSFDVCMSFGLAEHFTDAERRLVFQRHLDLLRSGGVLLISVPNRFCLPYRVYKFTFEALGRFSAGYEQPFDVRELRAIAGKLDVTNYRVFGGSIGLWYVEKPLRLILKLIGLKEKSLVRLSRVNSIPTPVDHYLAYSLTLVGQKGDAGKSHGTVAKYLLL